MIFERHLIKNLLSHFAITLGAIICIVWLSQIMKLAFIIELGSSTFWFWLLSISALPTILVTILPLAIVVSYFGLYSFLNSDRELLVLMSSGLNNWSLAKPALKLAIIITFICYLFSFYLGPISYHFLKNNLNNFRNNYVTNIIHEKSFNQISKNITLYVDSKDNRNTMSKIIIFDNRNLKEPSIIFANKGVLIIEDNTPTIILYEGLRQVINKHEDMTQMSFENFRIELPHGFTERTLSSMDLQEYTIMQLFFPDESIPKQRLKQINIEKHQRIIWPGYILAFAIVTLAIFLKHPYARVVNNKSLFKIIFALIIILYLHFTFHNFAQKNHIFIILCYMNLFSSIIYGYIKLRR